MEFLDDINSDLVHAARKTITTSQLFLQ